MPAAGLRALAAAAFPADDGRPTPPTPTHRRTNIYGQPSLLPPVDKHDPARLYPGDTRVQDERPLPETKKLKGYYGSRDLADLARNALERDVDPNLQLSVALQEGIVPVADRPDAVMEAKRPDFGADMGANLRAHAARVPAGSSTARQLQAWNGTGKPHAGMSYGEQRPGERGYGGQRPTDLSPNFYGDWVLGVDKDVTRRSPALQSLIGQVKAEPFRVRPAHELAEIGDPSSHPYKDTARDLTLRSTRKDLLRR